MCTGFLLDTGEGSAAAAAAAAAITTTTASAAGAAAVYNMPSTLKTNYPHGRNHALRYISSNMLPFSILKP